MVLQLSIIIPAHNEEKYIIHTLKAVNNQSMNRQDYEIIVVNDASDDKTSKLAKRYCDKILNVRKCKTIGQVRNKGAKIAKGKKLVFIDADTIVENDLLEKISKSKFVCGIPKYIIMGEKILTWLNVFNNFILKRFPKFGITPGSCMFFDKKLFNKFDGFNEMLLLNEDNDMFRKFFKKNYKIGLIKSQIFTSDRRVRKMGFIKYLIFNFFSYLSYSFGLVNHKQYNIIR